MPQSTPEVDVSYTAELARLKLTEEEKVALQHDITEIVGYVQQLQEVDVEGVEPTAHATRIANVTRRDAAAKPLDRAKMLANAPDTVDDVLVKVPKVLPGQESS